MSQVRTADRRVGYAAIGDYAIIGDCRSAALISRDGSLDWLCIPRLDGPSTFAALLDAEKGGCFAVRPTQRYSVERSYIGDTNVLETVFSTETGRVRLVDLMPVISEEEKRRQLSPDHQVLRLIECVAGEVEVEVVCDPRPDYARVVPRLSDHGALGLFYESGAEILVLRSEIALSLSTDRPGAQGQEVLREGERRRISLALAVGEPAVIPPLGTEAEAKIERSIRWWEAWVGTCRYEGPYRDHVIRSALTLKLMAYAPSGAVVAAPTTSLPERLGGVRNWDYRYCWLRDASLTLRALFDIGYTTEGEAFLSWLLHATRLTWPELQVMYDIFGETRLEERELAHLEGYAGSRPVRIGNGAADQFQLDVYGEMVDAAFQFVLRGGRLDRSTARMLVGLGMTVCRRWREPDEGIWETRAGRRHHTYSKVMCWVALDRLIRLHEAGHIKAPVQTFAAERAEIRREVESRGYSERLGSYVSALDGDELDASLLLLAIYGYVDPAAPRMRQTCERIHERLGQDGLLYRYLGHDGLPPGEGAFGICSFWGVECRARQGEVAKAAADFERVCSYANDVGLFAEEMDPESGTLLGNFPQAFTHVGLINAALTLAECSGRPVGTSEPRRRDERIRP